jgi:hypothetical protein
VALTSPVVLGGASTGVTDEQDLAAAARFCVEVAKEFSSGALTFYDAAEHARLVELYGSLGRLVGR